MSLAIAELKAFAADLAASPERWQHLVRHTGDVRVYEQIWDDEDVNAWVICWSEDQDTGFHDHDESAAAIAVVWAASARIASRSAEHRSHGRSARAPRSRCRRWRSTAFCTPVTGRR
jgi:hypothetical protein